MPQRAATVSGADENLPQVEREGGLQAILRLPADSSQAHPYHHTTNAAGTDLPTQSQGLGIAKRILACKHSCVYVRSSMRVQM